MVLNPHQDFGWRSHTIRLCCSRATSRCLDNLENRSRFLVVTESNQELTSNRHYWLQLLECSNYSCQRPLRHWLLWLPLQTKPSTMKYAVLLVRCTACSHLRVSLKQLLHHRYSIYILSRSGFRSVQQSDFHGDRRIRP